LDVAVNFGSLKFSPIPARWIHWVDSEAGFILSN